MHLFFIFHSSSGKTENEDDLGKKRGRVAKLLAALFSRRCTTQRCFSFITILVSSCHKKRLLKSSFFCSHKGFYYDPQENTHKIHSCEEFNVIFLMGPQHTMYTGTGQYLIPRHLEAVHPKIFSAECNYKTLMEAELKRCFYSSKLLLSYDYAW